MAVCLKIELASVIGGNYQNNCNSLSKAAYMNCSVKEFYVQYTYGLPSVKSRKGLNIFQAKNVVVVVDSYDLRYNYFEDT